jgi:outer membrane protein OmpA-like peptidoglycan-associated protein
MMVTEKRTMHFPGTGRPLGAAIGRTLVLAALAALAGCAGSGKLSPVDGKLAEPPARITDRIIDRDYRVFEALQARHAAMNRDGHRLAAYPLAKAQCWLDAAFHEYTRNDRSAFPQGAIDQAARLIGALEKGQTPPTDTPLVDKAARLRPDLWQRAGALMAGQGAACAAAAVACAEVDLVHAGHEYNQGGWRYANPYIRMAEDRIDAASRAAERCAPPVAAAPAAVAVAAPVVPAPAPAPAAPAPVNEMFALAADALFAFGRGDLAGMQPEGRAKLDAFAQSLKAARGFEALVVVGHTDRIGSEDYNLGLSRQRAETVVSYLAMRGLPRESMRAEGRGKAVPVVACEGSVANAALQRCLAPNRRVELEVFGVTR